MIDFKSLDSKYEFLEKRRKRDRKITADILRKPEKVGRIHMGNFGSKGGLQRIAPLKSGRNLPQSSSNKAQKAQTSVQPSSRGSSVKTA